jgi:hypothetical protein
MKLKYVFAITFVIIFISMAIGIYYKSSYLDFNKDESALDNFGIALLDDEFLNFQLQNMEENLDSSNIILAVRCEDRFHYRYSCMTQKVSIVSVFKGENLKKGDTFEIAKASNFLSLDKDAMYNGMYPINMGYVNEMIPGKTYLIFLDRKLKNCSKKDIIYIQSSNFTLAPIFCYENIINIPKKPENELIPCISYSQVKDNEFFIMSEESNQKLAFMKEKLFSKYKLD